MLARLLFYDVELRFDKCLRLFQSLAGLDALVPRVTKLGVARCSTVSEPRTAATATTELAGFSYGAACATLGDYRVRCGS